MNVKKDPARFLPMRTKEAYLGSQVPIQDGTLYFTVDTQKIFLGLPNGEKLSMGGNTGIFYGKKEIEYPNDGTKLDPEVIFVMDEIAEQSDIEGLRLPLVDDLILNIDGCFYRVLDILDDVSVLTNRITLQGSGGGGGGGSSDDGGSSFILARDGSQTKYFSSGSVNMFLGVIPKDDKDPDNNIIMVECSFDRNFEEVFYRAEDLMHPMGKLYMVDLINFKDQFSSAAKKVYFRAVDRYNVTRSTYYDVSLAELKIKSAENKIIQVKGNSFSYSCSIDGNPGVTDRIIEYRFYDENGAEIPDYYQFDNIESNESSSVKNINVSGISHGSYEMRVTLKGKIGGVTTIESNTIAHKVIRYNSLIGTPIFTYLLPDKIEQYTDIPIDFMLSYGDEERAYELLIKANEEDVVTLTITSGRIESYTLNFDKAETYKINFIIGNLGVDEEFNLVVEKYTGVLPVINIDRDDLKVYLTAKGRTNNNINKTIWPDYKNSTMQGSLENFYYGTINGWLKDDKNVNYLKLSQGAKVKFDDFNFYGDKNPKVTGMTFEIDFKINGVLDYSKSLIECVSHANDGSISSGFQVFGDQFKIHAAGAWKNAEGDVQSSNSLNIVENQRIRLSYVVESNQYEEFPMCYIYLNGVLSYANTYDKENAIFQNTGTQAALTFDSTYAEISVYNVRFYQSALNAQTVLNNYQATLDTLEERQAAYESNAIRDINGAIDISKIENGIYNLNIPYVKIVGGYKSSKDFTMDKEDGNVQALPTGPNAKKDYRAIDMEVHYPTKAQNPYFNGYKDFTIKTTFEDPSLNVQNGFGQKAVTGAIMYAQGTSSLEYPVKNLRVKFKGDKIKVRPDLEPVNLICFKADYMESSGSHNTGAANFVDDAYVAMRMQTPGQVYYEDETIVTCIKGHPCVIFWSKTGEPGTFEFIGKYNLNLDKATPEPFGFKNDEENPDSKFGYLTNENGEYIDYDGNVVSQENRVNSIFCFEFLDNNVQVCNFLPYQEVDSNKQVTSVWSYRDSWYELVKNDEGEMVPGWTIGFESRYPEDKTDFHDADPLYNLASWVNELAQLYGIPALKGESSEVPETRALSLQRFKNEYPRYLNKEYLLAYYVITNTLLMADSRVKNMMIATWGKEKCTWTNLQGETINDYNWIWYPIFYDMDTMLGLDNTGVANKYYYEEDTKQSLFNGDEVLWVLVRDSLEQEVAKFHSDMEANGALTASNILLYFNKNQANMANQTFYNEDAIYKYIVPFRTGYYDDLNTDAQGNPTYIAPGTSDKLYAAQGDRSMMREYFVSNRTRYLRGRYATSGYQGGDRIEFRMQVPSDPFIYTYYEYEDSVWNLTEAYKYEDADHVLSVLLHGESDENLLSTLNPTEGDIACILRCSKETDTEEEMLVGKSNLAVQGKGDFVLTSLGKGYIGVKIGQNGVPTIQGFNANETKTVFVDASSANGTESYILGLSNITNLGDLSNKYLQNFVIKSGDVRLERLKLGNHHRDYFNPNWKSMTSIGLNGCTYLKEFNLENCSTFGGKLDFTPCPAISQILLTGSSTSSVSLPKSSVIKELRLPTSIQTLSIDSQPYLLDSGFTLGRFVYTNAQDGYYENDYTKLLRINIRNTPIDSFTMAKQALANNLFEYCLQGVNWEISDQNDFILSEDGTELLGLKILSETEREGLRSITIYSEDVDLTPKTALTGKIKVKAGDLIVNEYALYDKYYTIFPNLVIEYESSNLQAAATIDFYNSETVLGEPYYSVLTDGSKDLAWLTSIDGPVGEPLSTPNKQPTNRENFAFDNKWKVAASSDPNIAVGTIIEVADFEKYTPMGDMQLTAIFKPYPRTYEVALYDWDERLLVKEDLEYEVDIGEALKDNTYSFYNYRPYEGNREHYRYEFKGWQSEYDFKNSPTTLTYDTLDGKLVTGKVKLYAYYAEENASTTPSNTKFFSINGNEITIASKYRSVISGKITFPSTASNGSILETIGTQSCYGAKGLTHVYFLSSAKFVKLDASAFEGCSSLIYMNLPDTIQSIENRALADCKVLKMDKLPAELNMVGVGAFAQMAEMSVSEFGTTKSASKLTRIKQQAFSGAAINANLSTVSVGKSLQVNEGLLTVDDNAFLKYGGTSLQTVYIYESVVGDRNSFGFPANANIEDGPPGG